jgi:hypothetical protein
MLNTFVVSALAQTARLTSPRITPASWHPGVTAGLVGPASGSRWIRLAAPGLASGTAMTSMKSPFAGPPSHPAALELLLYTIRLPPETPATDTVCDPHGRRSSPTRTGSSTSLMSKMWTPSKPGATVAPSQFLGSARFVFQDRTRMSSHTTMSPWSPLQRVREINVGSPGSLVTIRNPS